MFIAKEIPSGTVNGSNTVFNTANAIAQLDDVFLDGAIYLGTITVLGTQITLADAPTTSIYVDYYDAPPPTPDPTPGFLLVNDAYNSMARRLKDVSDVPQATFIEWCDFINKFMFRFLVGSDPERFLKTTSVTVTSGNSQYLVSAVASDFRDVQAYGAGVFYSDGNGNPIDQQLSLTGYGSRSPGYWFNGDGTYTYINFTPQPTQTTQYFLRYMPNPPTINAMGDYFTLDKTATSARIIPEEFRNLVVNALVTLYSVWDEEVGAEAYSDVRFVRCLDELAQNIRIEPNVFGLDSFSSAF